MSTRNAKYRLYMIEGLPVAHTAQTYTYIEPIECRKGRNLMVKVLIQNSKGDYVVIIHATGEIIASCLTV